MIEEPFRWVEAIANRREYIEGELERTTPVVALSGAAGILFATFARNHRKIFEVYDRIALGAGGHPGDIERLRMAAIELASTEGFSRSPSDVALQRMISFSLSPTLKAAFEQVYGAPFLVRLLLGELGGSDDSLLVLEYDGSIQSNRGGPGRPATPYACIAPSAIAKGRIEAMAARRHAPGNDLERTIDLATDLLAIGLCPVGESGTEPSEEMIRGIRESNMAEHGLELGLLDRHAPGEEKFRMVIPGAI